MKKLWFKWTFNCAIGELLGIACAGAIAFLVNMLIGEPHTFGSKLVVLLAMMFAGLIEGTILGLFQWKVLVTKFQNLPQREWIFYTVLVAVLGWFLGMLPSLIFIPPESPNLEVDPFLDFSDPFVFTFLSVSAGLLLGAIFGLFQWFSLRKYTPKAYKWIVANALGWGMGLGWIYLFASFPTDQSTLIFNILMGLVGGVLAGFSVGAITGLFLLKI